MIVIAIIGILAAIALPAYSSYMKKAKYTEVMNVAESVKTPIALCIQEHGLTGLANCINGKSGFGWEIKTNTDYATKYVSKVDVSPVTTLTTDTVTADTKIITVTVTPDGTNIQSTGTLILNGEWTVAGQLNWKVDSSSGCVTEKLCNPS